MFKTDDQKTELEKAQKIQEKYQNELLKKDHVVGVGVGLRKKSNEVVDEVVVVVFVTQKVSPERLGPGDLIPNNLDGFPVDVQETGEITLF
jgi:hypothetical protein